MNVLIFGASGKTGRHLLKQALPEHRVTAFVRKPSSLVVADHNLRIAVGDVKFYDNVYNALEREQAVIVVLGANSPFKRDLDLIDGIRNIVKAMEARGASRIIYLSFAGVNDSRQQLGLFRFAAGSMLSAVVKDHEEKEKIIQHSSLEWTIVRPALLSDGPHTGNFKSGENLRPGLFQLMISRADVADFMLRQLKTDHYLRKTPLLTR